MHISSRLMFSENKNLPFPSKLFTFIRPTLEYACEVGMGVLNEK
jgi:hypothetical protein